MDLSVIQEYVVVVVTLLCVCVGYIIKHLIPSEKVDKFIPLIVGTLGVVLNLWYCGWELTPEVILGGLVSGLASTGLHQIFKQLIEPHNVE